MECIICFNNINNDDKILQCKKCNILFHKNCYERWNRIKKDNKCIYCMSKNTIINIGLIVSFLLVSFILWNTNTLFQILKNEERAKMELWASAQKELIKKENLNNDYGNIVFDVLQKIGNTPIIL